LAASVDVVDAEDQGIESDDVHGLLLVAVEVRPPRVSATQSAM
jgi:hypothetical protein